MNIMPLFDYSEIQHFMKSWEYKKCMKDSCPLYKNSPQTPGLTLADTVWCTTMNFLLPVRWSDTFNTFWQQYNSNVLSLLFYFVPSF